jgi:acetylornithine deacetylase/succinyl-diaminopimelate desuccinylase-like protein
MDIKGSLQEGMTMTRDAETSRLEIAAWLGRESEAPEFKSRLADLLSELCSLRSIPGENVAEAAREEAAVFDRLMQAIRSEALPGRIEKLAIDEGISKDRRYTKPYYTSDERPYLNRSNLIHIYEPEAGDISGSALALNAHIDTVAPYFEPYLKEQELFGRGACDDKGCCVAILGASILLERLRKSLGVTPRNRIVSMYVIDEESGGNGSLALAADARLSTLYDTIVVAESTQGQIHVSNRGAVWYKVELGTETPGATAFALKVVRAFEREGRLLRSESDHPQFPSRPVQTCHGVLGAYGEHPSRICGCVEFSIAGDTRDFAGIRERAERGLAGFIAEYGDRTKAIDPFTKLPKIAKHYELSRQGGRFLLKVYGNAGHMGSSLENDNAITKAAFIVPEIQGPGVEPQVSLARTGNGPFVLEGGQGFLPSHSIEQVQSRMGKALADLYEDEVGLHGYEGPAPILSFDKLHNEAFARDPGSIAAMKAVEAARLTGIRIELPLSGFPVSCDARLFASFHEDKQVLTVGPGSIRFAHADNEHIGLAELAQGCAFFALYALSLTGALGPD